ncbi:MAG: hypothetical protein WBW79_07315 [Desulfocapsaceae bacterium]
MQTPLFRRLVFSAALCAVAAPLAVAQTGSGPELLFDQTSQWQLPYAPTDIVQSVDGARIFVLTDNNRVLIYEPNGQLKGSVEVAPGITAIESDARGENLLLIDTDNKTLSSFSIDFVAEIDIAGSPIKGNPDAPVTIAVFSDFE